MANPAALARQKAQTIWPGAVVVERGRGHIKHRHPTESNRFMLDTQVGGVGWHYGPALDQEVDTAWEPAVAPWQYKMVKAEFNAYLLSRLDAGMVGRYTDPNTGEYVEFDPQNLQWTNDLNQIQPIGVPQNVNAVISDDLATWPNGYGPGRHFSWQAQTARFEKLLTIDSLASLPTPEPFIRSGGNPSLELQLTFRRSAGVGIWVNGTRWDTGGHADRATSGLVEFRLITTGQVLWWFNLPRSWDSIGEQVIGTFWFKRQGQSLNVFHRIPLSWIEDPTRVWPISVDVTVDKQVAASGDDGLTIPEIEYYDIVDASLYTGKNGDYTYNSWYRFIGITIPQSSTITVAYLSLYEAGSAGTPLTKIWADDQNNPTAPTNFSNYQSRTTTSAGVDEDGDPGANGWHDTSSIVPIIQELVDSYDYLGEAIQILHKNDGGTGANYRRFYSYNYSGNVSGPKLHIEYTAGGISLTPSSLAVPMVVPTPTLSFGAKALTPSALAAPVALPSPALSFGAKTLTPSALAMPVVVPDPTLSFGAKTVTPSPIAIPMAIPTPALSFGAKVLVPDPVAMPSVIPIPTLSFGAKTLIPSALDIPIAAPAPTLSFGTKALVPNPVVIPAVIPAPILSFGAKTLTPSALAMPVVVPSPALTFGAKGLTPDPLVIPVVTPFPALSFGVINLAPDSLAASIIIPAPSLSFITLNLTPAPLAVSLGLPAPSLSFGVASLTPQPLAAIIVIPAPMIVVGAAEVPVEEPPVRRGAPFVSIPAVSPRRRWPLTPDGVVFSFLFDLRLTTRQFAELDFRLRLAPDVDLRARMMPGMQVTATVSAVLIPHLFCFLPGSLTIMPPFLAQVKMRPVRYDLLSHLEETEKRLAWLEAWRRNLDDESLLGLTNIN